MKFYKYWCKVKKNRKVVILVRDDLWLKKESLGKIQLKFIKLNI